MRALYMPRDNMRRYYYNNNNNNSNTMPPFRKTLFLAVLLLPSDGVAWSFLQQPLPARISTSASRIRRSRVGQALSSSTLSTITTTTTTPFDDDNGSSSWTSTASSASRIKRTENDNDDEIDETAAVAAATDATTYATTNRKTTDDEASSSTATTFTMKNAVNNNIMMSAAGNDDDDATRATNPEQHDDNVDLLARAVAVENAKNVLMATKTDDDGNYSRMSNGDMSTMSEGRRKKNNTSNSFSTISASTTLSSAMIMPAVISTPSSTSRSRASTGTQKTTKDNQDDNKPPHLQQQEQHNRPPICRVVALSDGQIPPTPQALPSLLFTQPHTILRKLDDIYHAMAHEETRRLKYMEQRRNKKEEQNDIITQTSTRLNGISDDDETLSSTSSSSSSSLYDAQEEQKLVSVVRTSLEDAGFELLTRRDLDLCDALNAGYLLRLSILPDVTQLDSGIAQEFYPEYFQNGTSSADILFQGKVLVFWRGYSKEVSRGRLLLPKIDYLQASLVQQSAAWAQDKLTRTEQGIAQKLRRLSRSVTATSLRTGRSVVDRISILRNRPSLRKTLRSHLSQFVLSSSSQTRERGNGTGTTGTATTHYMSASTSPTSTFFKLARYGGSKIRFGSDQSSDGLHSDRHSSNNMEDALKPFLICEDSIINDNIIDNVDAGYCAAFLNDDDDDTVTGSFDQEMYNCLNHGNLQCRYDRERLQQQATMKKKNNMENTPQQQSPLQRSSQQQQLPPVQLLERVSIRNIVDVFSRDGRRNLLRTLFSKSELVEPTYQEVVVVWRPLPPKQDHDDKLPWVQRVIKRPPPKWMYEIADMFDIQGLPQIPETPVKPDPQPLELRTFDDVPMSNIAAVLPKTKLVFRPADAFVFDFVSIVSLALLISSQRFDSPRLDLLAIVSVSLWFVRLIIRYSNKLARYDLLVKTFLTSKISHRNAGALKYLATEAGSQRATRAGLVYAWLSGRAAYGSKNSQQQILQQDDDDDTTSSCMGIMNRQELLRDGPMELNDLVNGKQVRVDVDAALNDLEDLKLISTTTSVVATPVTVGGTISAVNGGEPQQQQIVTVVRDADTVVDRLRQAWNRIFEGKLSLNTIIGRRDHGDGSGSRGGMPEL